MVAAKSLDKAILWKVETPSAVVQIDGLEKHIVAIVEPNHLSVFNKKTGKLVAEHKLEGDRFVTDYKGSIIYLKYHDEEPNREFVELNPIKGTEISCGRVNIDGSLYGLAAMNIGGDAKSIFALSEIKNKVNVTAFVIPKYGVAGEKWTSQVTCNCVPRKLFYAEDGDSRTVFASSEDRSLVGFDPIDGKRIANYDLQVFGMVEALDGKKDMLAIGAKHGHNFGLIKDGTLKWSEKVGPVMAVKIVDNIVLAGTEGFGGNLIAKDIDNGKTLFNINMPKNRGIWSMYVGGRENDRRIYLGTGIGGEGAVYAIDLEKLLK